MYDIFGYVPSIEDLFDALLQGNAGGDVCYHNNVERSGTNDVPKTSNDTINIDLDVKVITITRKNSKLSVNHIVVTKERDTWEAKAKVLEQKYAALEKSYKGVLDENEKQKLQNARKDGKIEEKDKTIRFLQEMVSDVLERLAGHHVVNNNTTNNIGGGQTQLNGGNGLQKNDK